MDQAAQKLGIRTAAFEALGPQPDLAAGQMRDPAFPHPVENQQRIGADAFHKRDAGRFFRLDLAEPAAPCRIAAA